MSSLQLSNYDFVFGIIILISMLLAIFRGGVAELLSISTWFIALFVVRNYSELIERFIPNVVSNPLLRSLLSYLLAFLAVAVVITIIKIIFHKIIHSAGLGGLNYALGAVFGIIRGFIIGALLIIVMEMFNFDKTHSWQKSWFSPVLIPTVTMIVNAIPERIKNINQEIGHEAANYIAHESSNLGKK
mgnify:FL=1|jgi:membrane protein required for colicin V production